MRHSELNGDPYFAAMKRYEKTAGGYLLIAFIFLASAYFVGIAGGSAFGMFEPMVMQVKTMFGIGLLLASATACVASMWKLGRRAYFAKWPERFNYYT